MSHPVRGSTSPAMRTVTRNECPCTRRHLWSAATCGRWWAASKRNLLASSTIMRSHAPGLGVPDHLVKLELEADVEPVLQHPARHVGRREPPVRGRQEHLAATVEAMF